MHVQVTSPVQWETTLNTLLEKGLENTYELGPGKVRHFLLLRSSAAFRNYPFQSHWCVLYKRTSSSFCATGLWARRRVSACNWGHINVLGNLLLLIGLPPTLQDWDNVFQCCAHNELVYVLSTPVQLLQVSHLSASISQVPT